MERSDLEMAMEQVLPYENKTNYSSWLLLEIHSVNKLVKRLTIQLEKRGLCFCANTKQLS